MMTRRTYQSGFTLVELIIVMAIIGILAGVVLVNVGPQRAKAARTRAIADIKEMDTAIEIFHADNGSYPTTQQGLQALFTQPTAPPIPRNWQGPYIKHRKRPPVDPWGNEYIYLCPGQQNPDSYDLYSYGADGRSGGSGKDADVLLWEEE
jgi:general secretion pathway protein G